MSRVLTVDRVQAVLRKGATARMAVAMEPGFQPGDAVTTRNFQPTAHTRLPRYLRGRPGVIDRDHGVFVFADSNAAGSGPCPQHLYSVRFAAADIWGEDGHPADFIYADLWDAHLESRG